MSKLFNWAAARIVAAFALALPLAADASPLLLAAVNALEKENPVTGETEIYDNGFDSEESSEWNSAGNWTLKESDKVPFVSGGNYDPALVDGKTVSTSTAIDGWTLRVGAYNNASVTWLGGITKIQAGGIPMWLTAADTSKITIASFAGNQLEGSDSAPFKLTSENAGGITWSAGLTSSSNTTLPFWYYLKGAGTVVYGGDITVANAQVIKMADVTLSGNEKSVQSKTLVTFGSGTTKTFTADATIKRLTSLGEDLSDDAHLATITSGATTLTTADAVGTCELVQTSTAIVLYWVDGDPADLAPTVYKPSISVNFTSGTSLSTLADVGIGDYAIPGTSWNNLIGNNGSLTTVNGVDSTGASSTISGAKVTISGTRGYWTKGGLSAASDLRQAYIDDADGNATPTIVVEGIPYYSYKLVLYFSNDTDGRQFGHLTINGANYKWDNTNSEIVTCDGTESDVWGSSSSTAYTEGGNYLVFPAMDNPDGKLTIVGHRWSGTQRMGVAAIQIVEVKPDAGANDLVIEVDGDTVYPVNEAKDLSGTVYITGFGTLTLAGEAKISADTINVGPSVTLNVNSDRLDADTFTGSGTVVYDGVVPPTGKGWTDSTWIGTVWLKNKTGITGNDVVATSVKPNSLGNTNSKVKFSGVSGWLEAPVTYNPEIVLENAGYDYALKLTDGNSPNSTETNRCTVVKKLSGSGTLCCGGTSSAVPTLKVYDASGFTGSINTVNADNAAKTGLVVVFCDEGMELPNSLVNLFINSGLKRTVYVASGKTVTLDSAATWTAATGFVVEGTLNANGTLASSASAAVTGAGTVVFNGKLPSPTGDTWWKNGAWDGTVQIKGLTGFVGSSEFTGSVLMVNDYGNADSILELNGCTGWMPYGFVEGDNVCTVPLKITGTLTINNGISNSKFTINKLLGNGTIYTDNNTATTTIQVLDSTEFTGRVQLNKKRVVFGETVPASYVIGQIYVGAGQTLTVPNSNVAWYGTGGITVDGELRAAALSNFGGGTTITTTDNGVLTLTSTGNGTEGETDTDYARITGTGSLKYEGTGWRALSTNNFPTAVTLVNEQAGDILLSRALTYTVGSLSGSKNFQGNYGSGNRYLNVVQSKDTEWSGKVVNDDSSRFAGLKLDASSTGTLTLSGTASQNVALEVNGGAVNLTGTWVGATTVAGTFGGPGTLTGDLTFSDGATFKAFAADDADGLVVSGAVTYPAEGTVTVDVSAIEPETDVALIKAADLDASKFALAEGTPASYTLEVVEGVLTLKVPHVTITVPSVANTTVIVKIGDETIGTASGDYNVAPDSVVTVTYAAVEGYEISGTTEYTIDTSNNETTFNPAGTTEVKQYVAYVVFPQESGQSFIDVTNNYTTVSNAIDAAKAMRKTVVLIAQPEATDTYAIAAGEIINIKKGEFTFDGIIFPEGSQYINTTTETAGVTQYKCAVYTAMVQYPGQEPVSMTGQLIQILGGLYSGYVPGYAGTVVTVLDGSDATVGDAMPEVFTYDSEAHTYTLKTMVASINTGAVDIYYPTISNAFEAVVSGQTIKVLCDNTSNVRSVRVKEGTTVTLDLNGFTVTGPSEDNPMFWLEDGSAFVITDTTEGKAGKLVSEASKVVWSSNPCTLTLTAGTLESTTSVPVYIYFGGVNGSRTVNINGGRLVSNSTSSSALDYCVMNASGTVNMRAGEIVSACGGFGGSTVNVSGGTVTVGTGNGIFRSGSAYITVTGGTFNKTFAEAYLANGYEVVNNGDGTYTVRKDNGWMYAAPGYWDYTGTWTEGAALGDDKVTFSDGATYSNRTASAGQLVTVAMTLSFDDVNDDEDGYEGAKAAIRLGAGETEGTYVFQLYASENSTPTWKNATGFAPEKETDYNIVFVLDLTNKTYTASVVTDAATTNVLSVGGSTTIAFANQNNATPVQQIEFVGAGTVSSIEGSYEDAPVPEGFVENDEVTLSDGTATLTAAQATWLNQFGVKLTVAARLAELSSAQFTAAYLLNLDIMGTFSYTFNVTGFGFETVNETECAVVTVSLTRTGALKENSADKPIVGTLKLKGTATLGTEFTVLGETAVKFDTDADFSDGATETTVTVDTTETDAKFFQPVIE